MLLRRGDTLSDYSPDNSRIHILVESLLPIRLSRQFTAFRGSGYTERLLQHFAVTDALWTAALGHVGSMDRVLSISFTSTHMGQYFKPVNTDKQEFVCPWCIGGGAKLWEWAVNRQGAIFTLLLRQSSGTGGGDIGCSEPQVIHMTDGMNIADVIAAGVQREGHPISIPPESIIGRWAGDRIVLVGDYDDSGLYAVASQSYLNISEPLVETWNKFVGDEDFQLQYRCCSTCAERLKT
ncbi:MAG: hypothetical protein R3C18_13855 [Planctomycetaceae bacterium]